MPTTLRRCVAATLALFGALVLMTGPLAPARAAQAAAPANCGYPAAACECPSLSISTTTPAPGERLQVTGRNFVGDTTLTLRLKPAGDRGGREFNVGTVRTTAAGSFATGFVMPAATTNRGNYVLHAVNGRPRPEVAAAGISCPVDPTVRLRVDGNDDNRKPSSNEPSTAFTGVNLLWLLVAAAVLVGAGLYANHRGRAKKNTVRSIHG